MHYAKELLERYYSFYRAERKSKVGFTTEGCTRPLKLAMDILEKQTRLEDAELIDTIAARLTLLMRQIHSGTASVGRYVLYNDDETEAIYNFSKFLVEEYFRKELRGDRGRLVGNKQRLLINTCDFLYRRREDAIATNAS